MPTMYAPPGVLSIPSVSTGTVYRTDGANSINALQADVGSLLEAGFSFTPYSGSAPAGAVAITGGSINGTMVGNTTPASGAFTTANINDPSANNTASVAISAINNVNGANLSFTGTGTAPNKYIRAANNNLDILNSAYAGPIARFNDSGRSLFALAADDGINVLQVGGNVAVKNIGSGLRVIEGANAKQGAAVLVAGAVTVANTSVTANSRIFLTSQVDGGTVGFLRVSARVAGTSFTITSSSATDTSTVAYEIFEPA